LTDLAGSLIAPAYDRRDAERPLERPLGGLERPMKEFVGHAAQIAVAAGGGLLFSLLGVPAAWLSGAVVAVVIWGALGFGRPMPRPLADAAMLISGATMGAGVTPEAVAAMASYPMSLVALGLGVVAITFGSMLWLTRVSGWRREDALLASVPGALSTVFAIAVDRNLAVAPIAVVQAFRLFVIITILPSAIVFLGGGGHVVSMLPGAGREVASAPALALVLAGGLGVGLVLQRVRVAAAILLGATVVSSTLHATALTRGTVPPLLAVAGLVLIGVFVAERFRTLDPAALRRTIPAAAGSFVVGNALAAAFAILSAWLAGVSVPNALVAFAPGGLEAMMVLSLVLGLDPLYVGIHHLARFLGIGLVLPLMATWLRDPESPTDAAETPEIAP
jgi:membrane AbrB-like protein